MSRPQALIQMWNPYREILIQQHRFYVNEASTRLMSQFDNINADADKAAEAWLERRGERFDPDRDDEGAIYEEAESVAIQFYRQLDERANQALRRRWDVPFLGKEPSIQNSAYQLRRSSG